MTTTREIESGFRYLDPHAEPGAPADPYRPRLATDRPAVIALVSNLFTDATGFLDDLREPIAALLPGTSFVAFDKGSRRNSSFPLGPERIAEIAASCDAVIAAFGHCGSCTAGTVRDSVSFARAGIPVVALVTEKFREEAAFIARSGGIPDLPFVFLPHPVAGREYAFQRALSVAVAPLALAALRDGLVRDATHILETAIRISEAA